MSTTTNDVCWIAGLLEGEGNFIFHNTPTIQLNMIDLDTIDNVRKIVSPNSKISLIVRENKLVQYKLHICGIVAIQWMMTIYCKMSIRRKAKIREVVQNWKEMTGRTESSRNNLKKARAIETIMMSRKMTREEATNLLNGMLKSNGVVN